MKLMPTLYRVHLPVLGETFAVSWRTSAETAVAALRVRNGLSEVVGVRDYARQFQQDKGYTFTTAERVFK